MKSSELMARAEHALRTGQTENLFPALARRALEVIAEEKAANRREWAKLDRNKARQFAAEAMMEAFRDMRDNLLGVLDAFAALGRAASTPAQADYALVSGGPR